MIYFNGKQVVNIGDLSTRFQSVLSMIQGGLDWFNWAVNDSTVSSINAGSEDQLLTLIQQGIHADKYIRFNTFRASISKILTMSDSDVEHLANIRNSVNDNNINMAVLLQRNCIISYNSISEAAAYVAPIIPLKPDLLQYLSFEDMLALAEFIQVQKNLDNALTSQAVNFATGLSSTIPEFIHLSCFFQEVLQNQLPANLILLTQNSEIQSIYYQLLPITNTLLYTPNIGSIKDEKTLRESIPQISRVNRFIGYSTTSAALLNLVKNVNVTNQTEQSLQSQIDNHMSSIKSVISSDVTANYNLSQDGTLATLRYEKDQSVVIIGIDDSGSVFLLPGTQLSNNKLN